MFVATNEGYAPLTDIQVDCIVNFTTDRGLVSKNNTVHFTVATTKLHTGHFTVPCTRTVTANNEPAIGEWFAIGVSGRIVSAEMTINISYSFFGIKLKSLRRSQSFRVVAEKADDKSFHWAFN